MSELPIVAIASFGGTIAMAAAPIGEGVVPELGADDLVASVADLTGSVRFVTTQIANVGSGSVRFEHVLAGVRWARGQVDAGACGVVLTHGTDTIEESAYLADLLWDREAPMVFTGAMRSADEPGADGPANLRAAIAVALSPMTRGLGSLVVLNDQVFRGDRVRKSHTFAVDAFDTPFYRPIGRFTEGRVEIEWLPAQPRVAPLSVGQTPGEVVILGTGIGDDGFGFRAVVDAGAGALVIDGVGAGHVSGVAADVVGELVGRVPVVMASRTRGGRTGTRTYAYPGSEVDLIGRGVIMAGRLNAAQARLLAWVLLSAGAPIDQWHHQFAVRGGA